MIDFTLLRCREGQFKALTSLTVNEFDELFCVFSPLWQAHYRHYDLKGNKRSLPAFKEHAKVQLKGDAIKLFFVLYYLKNNPLQEALALTFDLSQGKAAQWLKSLLPVLEKSLKKLDLLPARSAGEWQEKLTRLESRTQEALELWVDGSERAVTRSGDYEAQKEMYSGKKKTHTVKNTIVTTVNQEVVFLGDTSSGKTHDKRLLEEDDISFPKGSILHQDTGYQGHKPHEVEVRQPKKKTKNKPLSDEDKEQNKELSSRRVRVEHSISGVKRLHIVSQRIRLWKEAARDTVMMLACGLHNLRVNRRLSYQMLS